MTVNDIPYYSYDLFASLIKHQIWSVKNKLAVGEIDYPIFCRLEKLGIEEFKESNSKEKHNDVSYFIGSNHKTLKFRTANRHNGDVGRKNCNPHAGRNVAETGSKSSLRKNCESLESVSKVPNEYHHSDHQHLILDG